METKKIARRNFPFTDASSSFDSVAILLAVRPFVQADRGR